MSKSCRNLIGHMRVAFCFRAKTSVIAKLLKSNSIPHTDFFSKGFAKRLVLKQRHKVNRKFIPTGTRLAGKSNSFFQVPVRLLGAKCKNAAFLQLACTCEKTCESDCAQSTKLCTHLQLAATRVYLGVRLPGLYKINNINKNNNLLDIYR